MRRWRPVCRASVQVKLRKTFSSYTQEQVQIRTGSVGHVSIDLFNVSRHPPSTPLIVHLPPFPGDSHAALPSFLQQWPVASIKYRWECFADGSSDQGFARPLCWPTPVHDVSFAFAWLVENLAPAGNSRRDIYVYGSHLGASLAASLGLTEAHAYARFAVRGFIAYNGIYNWTMFLPDHRINQAPKRAKSAATPLQPPEGSLLYGLQQQLPSLFQRPSNLFDPFASPSLFFHSPGVAVPKTFGISTSELADIDALAKLGTVDGSSPLLSSPKAPRKSYLVFPPRKSTLKIPRGLLLHDASPPLTDTQSRLRKRRSKRGGNTFEAQAQELADLMRRSIDKVELKERVKWDDETDSWDEEAQRRVQVIELAEENGSLALDKMGESIVSQWLGDSG
ncbi:hypothetical protein HJFPF1_09174 [Paramyrothecium foliicola]|nr:hypothetical protein HJFPF1_09174 [Paramyrothecium foliicola]